MKTNETTQYDKMTKMPIAALIIRLSVPTIISMLITNLYNLADTAFVGRLGTSASGAVGVVFGFMAIIQAIGFMFGQGSGSIISRALGGRRVDYAGETASTGVFAGLVLGIVITVGGFLCLDPLVLLLGSTKTIAPYAKNYISYILLAAPFMTTSFVLNNILRYEGKASLGMIGLLAGALLNICGDPFFMFALHLGIAGAGISTALSQVVSFLILLSMFLRGKTQSKLSIHRAAFDGRRIFDIMATGLPSLLRQGLNSITTVLLNSQSAVYGDEAVAAMSIVSRIVFFVFSIALGIGQGFQPVCGFNYGAGKYSRVRKGYWVAVCLSEGLMVVADLMVLLSSGNLIAVFRNDPQVIEIGTRALRLQCFALLFFPIGMVTEMLFQSTGKKLGASVLSSFRSGLFFIPALLILARVRGLAGIEEAQPVSFLLSFIPAVFFALWFFKQLPKEDLQGELQKN